MEGALKFCVLCEESNYRNPGLERLECSKEPSLHSGLTETMEESGGDEGSRRCPSFLHF